MILIGTALTSLLNCICFVKGNFEHLIIFKILSGVAFSNSIIFIDFAGGSPYICHDV